MPKGKRYSPEQIISKWQQIGSSTDIFQPPKQDKPPYTEY
jgi:hypothetical protein